MEIEKILLRVVRLLKVINTTRKKSLITNHNQSGERKKTPHFAISKFFQVVFHLMEPHAQSIFSLSQGHIGGWVGGRILRLGHKDLLK